MKLIVSRATGPCVCGALAFLAAAPASGQYTKGFEWNRAADWTPGVEAGSRRNNPGPDSAGSAVWGYEMAHGGALGSANPWFQEPTSVLTWDDAWWATGRGAWSVGDDKNPPVFADFMTHNLGPAGFDNIPLVRWSNPAGDGTVLDMAGTLRILWTGEDFVGAPTDVEVVVAMFDASTDQTSVLFEQSVSKPHEGLSVGDWADVSVLLKGVTLDEGDSILVSARGQSSLASHWIDIHDGGLSVTLVPGPAGGAILTAGLVLMARRRRN